MKQKFKNSLAAFVAMCAVGAFIGAAGGVVWGTVGCGFLTGITLYLALVCAFVMVSIPPELFQTRSNSND